MYMFAFVLYILCQRCEPLTAELVEHSPRRQCRRFKSHLGQLFFFKTAVIGCFLCLCLYTSQFSHAHANQFPCPSFERKMQGTFTCRNYYTSPTLETRKNKLNKRYETGLFVLSLPCMLCVQWQENDRITNTLTNAQSSLRMLLNFTNLCRCILIVVKICANPSVH